MFIVGVGSCGFFCLLAYLWFLWFGISSGMLLFYVFVGFGFFVLFGLIEFSVLLAGEAPIKLLVKLAKRKRRFPTPDR